MGKLKNIKKGMRYMNLDNNAPLVSVLIPAYNRSQFFLKLL